MIRREELEAREERDLAPVGIRSRRSRGRAHEEAEHPYRTVFQRDRDRIIHSTAFRRLEYKTQVFVNHEGDYYRTRLTHTMEVVQIARTIARALGLNEDLTECLALSHDLGHGPFGHSGEGALNELMAGHGGFEHNAHGFRIVSRLERRYPDFPGLNLTYEVRESMLKHGDGSVPADFRPDEAPLLEARVADLADRIAYNNHDLDDALTAGILTEEKARGASMVDDAFRAVDERHPGLGGQVRYYNAIVMLIDECVTDVLTNSARRIAELGLETVEDVRACAGAVISFSPKGDERQEELHRFLHANFYNHFRVARMQEKAKRFLSELFHAYVTNPRILPDEVQEEADREGVHRAACDWIASMTDRQAQGEYVKVFQPFERM
ncbi:MAG: deoxyguanosinetriphosphate triphosphohydrolase [Planctomycetota bacterium]